MHKITLSRLIRITVVFILFAFTSIAPATAQVSAPLPVLTSVAASISAPDAIQVSGQGFTPGGNVFVALHDPWGERSNETRWTTASEPVFDMFGHDDPALGYRPGGVVREVFDHPCGQEVMVRAYDQATRSWSNVVDVASAC